MPKCDFCEIIARRAPAAMLYEDDFVLAFADTRPIRAGHVQIVPRDHIETFELLPQPLASQIIALGQRVARAQKRLYGVDRVGFVFSGNEVPHVHAHVLPLHASTDISSLRYFEVSDDLPRRALEVPAAALAGEIGRLRRSMAAL